MWPTARPGGLTARAGGLAAALVLAAPAAAWPQPAPHGFLTVALSPDGTHVAALESDVPAGGGDAVRSLVLRDTRSGAAVTVALPCGMAADCAPGAPAWSPDAGHVAFALRSPGSHARTIYTVAADGSGLAKLAAVDGTVVTLRYSRDGQLAALAVVDADKEVGASEAGGAMGGAVHEQRIAIVGAGTLAWASPPDLNVYEYDWLPDGTGFVGTAAPGDGDAHWWRATLYAFQGGAARVLFSPTDRQMQIAQPRVSPDGARVAFVGGLMSDFDNIGGDAFTMPLDGHGSPINLTAGQAVTVTSLAWHCGEAELLAGLDVAGETALADVPVDGGPMRRLWTGPAVLNASDGAVSIACGAGTSAGVRESFTEAPEIAVGRIGAWRALTSANAGVTAPVRIQSVTWTDDGVEAQGWLLLPTGADGARKLPMVVAPHGGPAWAYVPSFFGPSLLRGLSDAGYALLLPNPRGSFGRGEAFVRANARDFGGGDFRDIMAGVDAAIRAAPIDADRLGITGVSYGGFMTMWAVTHTPPLQGGGGARRDQRLGVLLRAERHRRLVGAVFWGVAPRRSASLCPGLADPRRVGGAHAHAHAGRRA